MTSKEQNVSFPWEINLVQAKLSLREMRIALLFVVLPPTGIMNALESTFLNSHNEKIITSGVSQIQMQLDVSGIM